MISAIQSGGTAHPRRCFQDCRVLGPNDKVQRCVAPLVCHVHISPLSQQPRHICVISCTMLHAVSAFDSTCVTGTMKRAWIALVRSCSINLHDIEFLNKLPLGKASALLASVTVGDSARNCQRLVISTGSGYDIRASVFSNRYSWSDDRTDLTSDGDQ